MIDLHSHILPGLDDGAKNLDESLLMARQSLDSGVTHVMCTPHIHEGVFDNDFDSINAAFKLLTTELARQQIPLKLALGSEVRINLSVLELIIAGELPFIGSWNEKSALLLELPHSHVPPGIENLIKWLIKHGVQPVIPHPERNRDILADYGKLKFLTRLGCIFQVTAGVFVDRFSSANKLLAEKMLEDGMISYIASDTHSVKRRPNDMHAAREHIAMLSSEEKAHQLTFEVPYQITSKSVMWI